MSSTLERRVVVSLRRHRMMAAGDVVGLAVSGGADSVALLLLFCALHEELGIRLCVLHLNHQLRGADADADEQFVARLAGERGLEFLAARADVAARAREQGANLEDVARQERYRFFSRVVESGRAARVAVAHTADDQAETVLAHLLRGTGPAGLAAIYPVVDRVVRPLLEVRRHELRDYLRARGQAWREDATNQDTGRLRARIRQVLLPLLAHDFQSAVVPRLSQFASLAREDELFWEALLDQRYTALVQNDESSLSIRIPDLLAPLTFGAGALAGSGSLNASSALSKRLVRRILHRLKGDRRQITAQHVEQVLHLASSCPSGHRVHLPAGVLVERCFDRLLFTLSAPGVTVSRGTKIAGQAYHYLVHLEGADSTAVSIPEIGRRFHLKVIDWPPHTSETRSQAQAIDRDTLRSPLVFRNWQPGDSYRPLGRRRVRKLKRLLLETRVAARERAGWPVLTSAGALVWARGLPVAEEFSPQEGTRAGLLIAEETL